MTRGAAVMGRFGRSAEGLGKSDRTRARLLDAAALVIGRDGADGASANEIALTAQVANGSFYNYFKDKDDIVRTVVFGILSDILTALEAAMAGLTDPAERVSFGTRQFIALASEQPVWGLALFRAVWAAPDLRSAASAHMRADLERGVRLGAFKVAVDDLLINIQASMIMTAVFAQVRNAAGPEAASRVAELQLRMLGVSAARAERIAYAAMTPLSLQT